MKVNTGPWSRGLSLAQEGIINFELALDVLQAWWAFPGSPQSPPLPIVYVWFSLIELFPAWPLKVLGFVTS